MLFGTRVFYALGARYDNGMFVLVTYYEYVMFRGYQRGGYIYGAIEYVVGYARQVDR